MAGGVVIQGGISFDFLLKAEGTFVSVENCHDYRCAADCGWVHYTAMLPFV